eukprot:SAG25_NODE_13009_length_272_cov_1.127168_1_plen_73_part_10
MLVELEMKVDSGAAEGGAASAESTAALEKQLEEVTAKLETKERVDSLEAWVVEVETKAGEIETKLQEASEGNA